MARCARRTQQDQISGEKLPWHRGRKGEAVALLPDTGPNLSWVFGRLIVVSMESPSDRGGEFSAVAMGPGNSVDDEPPGGRVGRRFSRFVAGADLDAVALHLAPEGGAPHAEDFSGMSAAAGRFVQGGEDGAPLVIA